MRIKKERQRRQQHRVESYTLSNGKEIIIRNWTSSDERAFQALLRRRIRATGNVIEQLGRIDTDELAENMAQDYDADDWWADFVQHSSPGEVLDTLDYSGVIGEEADNA